MIQLLFLIPLLLFSSTNYAKSNSNSGSLLTESRNFQLERAYVTYEFSGGRFGDNLLSYMHAKWISYAYSIPLLYKPFDYSSELVLDDVEIHYEDMKAPYQIVSFFDAEVISFSSELTTIYLCPYFPEFAWERENDLGPNQKPWKVFFVDWKDPNFRTLLKKLIVPKSQMTLITPTEKTINVALHYRDGWGYDSKELKRRFITKFPPLEFYAQGLNKIIDLFPNQKIYCYIFTDAKKPKRVADRLQKMILTKNKIRFDYRTKSNHNVLEDFFSLLQFDVLIHPQSNFSMNATFVHDYAVLYSPTSGKIDEAKLEINQLLYEKLLLR